MVLDVIVGLVALVAALWVIIDVLTKQPGMGTGEKVLWVVGAIVFSILTALVYYFVKKK